MQWYFLSDTQEQIAVQEDHLAGMVQTGVIRPNTLVWKEGMAQWVACSEIRPELFAQRHVVPVVGAAATARQTAAIRAHAPVPASAMTAPPGAATAGMQLGDGQVVRDAAAMLASSAGWMKLLGILSLISGVASILGALSLVVAGGSADGGLLPGLISGLFTATLGGAIIWMGMTLFQAAGKAREAMRTAQKHTLLAALQQNALFFKIWGISVISTIVASALLMLLSLSMLATLIGGLMQGNVGSYPQSEQIDGADGTDANNPGTDDDDDDDDDADSTDADTSEEVPESR